MGEVIEFPALKKVEKKGPGFSKGAPWFIGLALFPI